MTSSQACANCDRALDDRDRFCPNCGQEALADEARTFGYLLKASLAEATSLDSRLWRSMLLLWFRPGRLSREYRLGHRQRYLSPISLFLIANVAFFLAPSLTDFGITLIDQYRLQPYSPLIQGWIESVLSAGDRSFEEWSSLYRQRVGELAKTMVILHVPLLAMVTMGLTADKRLFYADHIVMALHFFAFLMWYLTLFPFVFLPMMKLIDALTPAWDLPAWWIAVNFKFVYIPFMLRSATGISWLRVIPTTVLFLLGLYAVHATYRLIQFVVTFGSITL